MQTTGLLPSITPVQTPGKCYQSYCIELACSKYKGRRECTCIWETQRPLSLYAAGINWGRLRAVFNSYEPLKNTANLRDRDAFSTSPQFSIVHMVQLHVPDKIVIRKQYSEYWTTLLQRKLTPSQFFLKSIFHLLCLQKNFFF